MDIAGFLLEPKKDANGNPYRGRLCLPAVQWTGSGGDAIATFTITADQVADAAENQLIWTDQSVQRGINPAAPRDTPRELNLADGYPDKRRYIFDASNADDIAEKLLTGRKLFLNPLIWNLRPRNFTAFSSLDENSIFLYTGRIYLPDSHHRHQAILKAVRAVREHPNAYPKFSGDRQFKVELYFLDKEDEGNYFFDKNQRPKPTAKSKAYDLTTFDDLSLLAKRVVEKSSSLSVGTNRVTDRLRRTGHEFITLSTLREMMRTYAGTEEISDAELEGLAIVAADFFEMLAQIRPELQVVDEPQRLQMRSRSLADAAVVMHAYASLMKDFGTDVSKFGLAAAKEMWSSKLQKLSPYRFVSVDGWTGDFFDKQNPQWARAGVVKSGGDSGKLTVLNTGGARAQATKVLRQHLSDTGPHQRLLLAANVP